MVEVDCTTAVVLKILDNKCKMLPGEKAAVLAVYDALYERSFELFDGQSHELILEARRLMGQGESDKGVAHAIHQLRINAEARIPKSTMKAYKTFLRDGLFG